MRAYLFRYDIIKRLSHGYCPIGPMGNAMRSVPSHPIPWGISHGNPIPMEKPAHAILISTKIIGQILGIFIKIKLKRQPFSVVN